MKEEKKLVLKRKENSEGEADVADVAADVEASLESTTCVTVDNALERLQRSWDSKNIRDDYEI